MDIHGKNMTNSEVVIVVATFLGPIFAVQAQKWIERGRERTERKESIFRALMATRHSRLSNEHVRALNMIDMAFYGRKIVGYRWQSTTDKAVSRCWREYFESLNTDNAGFADDQYRRLIEIRDEKFVALLSSIALSQNFDFEPLDLRKNAYSPVAHNRIENDNDAIRSGLAKILIGDNALKMEITNFPAVQSVGE